MKTRIILIIACIFFTTGLFGSATAGEPAPDEIVALANAQLVAFGKDPKIVAAVKQENAKGKTMDQIKALDNKIKAGDDDPAIQALLKNDGAAYLKEIQESHDFLEAAEEIYILDKQGAIASTIRLEEQYWFGGEEGFGVVISGKVFVGEIEIDDDEGEYMCHVLVPVWDGDNVIGAIDFGFELEDD